MNRYAAATCLIAATASLPSPARAEIESCINITSLPAIISSQGVYCLKQDLATAITSGWAIEIDANNVTLDCNGFKLGGLGAGPATQAVGIGSAARSNVVVRNCNVRGFSTGIGLFRESLPFALPSGNVVEDNRIEKSTRVGIDAAGDSSVVRGNIVFATGPNAGGATPIAIYTQMNMDIIDNTIDGVQSIPETATDAYGILSIDNSGGSIVDNRIRNVRSPFLAYGILTEFSSENMLIKRNIVSAVPFVATFAIYCVQPPNLAVGNLALGVGSPAEGCADGGGNVGSPPQ